jgi:membrane-bound metal-dependent hydrolase YbcI (DUF457 family)
VADRHVKLAALTGIIAANAPDWSEFFVGFPWPRAQYLELHRGITHSLVGALVEIIALTVLIRAAWWLANWVLRRTGRQTVTLPAWRWLALCVGVTVMSHLYMDWQGSYGWRPFLPWSARWYYLDWVAIADVFFWLVPLIGLAWGAERHWLQLSGFLLIGLFVTVLLILNASIVATWVLVASALLCLVGLIGWVHYWFGPIARRRAAVLALALLALYTGAQGVVSELRQATIRKTAVQRFASGATWAALTEVGRPFTWEAMYASPDTVASGDWRVSRNLRIPVVERAIENTSDGRAIAHFARFLAAEVDSTTKLIVLRDLRYARTGRTGWAIVAVRME